MKNIFKSISAAFFLLVIVFLIQGWLPAKKTKREFYQLTVYHYTSSSQEKVLDNYFQNALLPALHRMNIKNVGVFKNHSNDTLADKTMYVFMPVEWSDIVNIPEKLNNDKEYLSKGSEYLDAVYTAPPYSRMETIILHAFSLAPQFQLPKLNGPKKDRVYELRSYESATEKIFKNKVHMFNDGDEIGLFKRLNFNAAFYSEVVAGAKMPNLMYMTCHENRQVRDSNWKNFSADPYWKKLSSMPEYQHNVSHIDISFLYPTDYSDF